VPTPPLEVERWLRGDERRLFDGQADADRRHAIRVACRLLAAGHSDELLIRTALLHDVGKSGERIALAHRVAWVLVGRFARRLRPMLVRRGGAWAALAGHPAIGASRLRAIGSDVRLVALVAGRPLPGDEVRGQLLSEADDSV
jgi:hypothetical protein